MINNVRAVVFDLDGTLLNTLDDLADATNYALRHNGMPERTVDEVRMFVGNGVRRLIEQAVPAGTDGTLFEKTFADFKAYYVRHCQDKTCLYDGIEEMLKVLHNRGLKLAIVSNKLQAGVDELYERYFKDSVQVAVGEREGVARKPAPDMVRFALDSLGVSAAEAVYVGDSDVDLATARNSGLPCISVLWGFRNRAFLESHGASKNQRNHLTLVNIVVKRLQDGLGRVFPLLVGAADDLVCEDVVNGYACRIPVLETVGISQQRRRMPIGAAEDITAVYEVFVSDSQLPKYRCGQVCLAYEPVVTSETRDSSTSKKHRDVRELGVFKHGVVVSVVGHARNQQVVPGGCLLQSVNEIAEAAVRVRKAVLQRDVVFMVWNVERVM